ncbi:Bacterial regulatory protein, arsR family [uncultured archaeon]|nr:Bacterial regulatory protein, arsR family [uncultured archaeon]
MRQVRCCPADCAIKSNWEEELQKEIVFFKTSKFREANTVLKVLSHPSRLQIMMLLLKRDHCVCELIYILNERQNLVSYNLGILKRYKMIDSYNRSKHKYYKLNDNAIDIIRLIKESLIDK